MIDDPPTITCSVHLIDTEETLDYSTAVRPQVGDKISFWKEREGTRGLYDQVRVYYVVESVELELRLDNRDWVTRAYYVAYCQPDDPAPEPT